MFGFLKIFLQLGELIARPPGTIGTLWIEHCEVVQHAYRKSRNFDESEWCMPEPRPICEWQVELLEEVNHRIYIPHGPQLSNVGPTNTPSRCTTWYFVAFFLRCFLNSKKFITSIKSQMFYIYSCSKVFSWGWKSPSIELGQFSLNKFFSGGPEVSKNKWTRHLQLFSLIAEQINWVTLKHLSLHEWYFGFLWQFNFCFLCFWPGSCQILTLKSHFHIRDAAWSYHPKFTSLLLAPRTKVKKESGEIMLSAKAWNGRIVTSWLATVMDEACDQVGPDFDEGRLALAAQATILNKSIKSIKYVFCEK